MKKILVTGGAGYIGSVLCRQLLNKGYFVRILDILNFGGDAIAELLNFKSFEFILGDVRKKEDVTKALKEIDYVVHLAAIVGDPACAKKPELAWETNFESSKIIYELANKYNVKKMIYASTCSNYGKMDNSDSYVDENSKLAPISVYAETKVKTENYLLNQNINNICIPVCLRFSTIYGISPRIRFDLTVNEFSKEIAMGRELTVFGEQFWRPYTHVYDLCRSIILVLEAEINKVKFEVFNVGNTNENYTKKMLVEKILKYEPNAIVKYIKKDEDPRDYKVSFEKIRKVLGFEPLFNVDDGIKQILTAVKNKIISNPDNPVYKNI